MANLLEKGLALFGFELSGSKQEREKKEKSASIVPPLDEDGSGYATAPSGYFGQTISFDVNESKDNAQLIYQYRAASMHPEVDEAIENIITEAVTASENESSVKLILDNVEVSEPIKKKINEEFDEIVRMLKFNEYGYDIFKRWYVDGRIYYHLVVEKGKESNGIIDIRPIDATKIRKVREVKTKTDPATGIKTVESVNEYFLYQENPGKQTAGVKLTKDSVAYVTSGVLDAKKKKVVSHLHKALKPVNQLRMMEHSLVIYRMARAPERRIFYIDVGNLPRGKAEQYMKDHMAKYRNKIVYDTNTGTIKDNRDHMAMLEDFWLPRREGGRGTEITTLPGGENLGQIEDVIYFQRGLYKSLNVPIGRLDTEQAGPFGLGRPSEISREELKFQKFIDRLRMRFSKLFLDTLKTNLILKGVIVEDDWEDIENDIVVDYIRDNFFTELKNMEIWREKVQTLEQLDPFVGRYFSKEWIQKKILNFNDEEIEEIDKAITGEEKSDPDDVPISRLPPPVPEEE